MPGTDRFPSRARLGAGRRVRGRVQRVLLVLLASVAVFGGTAAAQTCQGVSSARCVGTGFTWYHAPPPGPEWQSTWAAFAIDVSVDGAPGQFGSASGHDKRRAARKDALERCRATGAQDCRIVLTFSNQCAVLALPDVVYGKRYGARAARTEHEAKRLALEECDSPECRIVELNCTIPYRVR